MEGGSKVEESCREMTKGKWGILLVERETGRERERASKKYGRLEKENRRYETERERERERERIRMREREREEYHTAVLSENVGYYC